jgi:4-hydroxybenzoate polyprenyltransferase
VSSKGFTLGGLIRLTRFWNLLIIGVAQYFAAVFLISKQSIKDWHLLVLSASTIVIAAAGYIINDYYDVKIDLINKPERVVIGKEVNRRYALLFHSLLSISGVALGLLLNWKIGAVNFLSAFLLWWYSNDLKRQPLIGNFVVALLTGLSILLVNILFKANHPFVIIYSVFAFSITLVREVVKDMEDLKGDNTFGCKTLPILLGIRKTKFILYLLVTGFIATVTIISNTYLAIPIYYLLLFLFAPSVLLIIWLARADTKKDFYQLSQMCKLIMLLGIASMVLI